MNDAVNTVLVKAKGLIVEHGWVTFTVGGERVGFCALAAVYRAAAIFEAEEGSSRGCEAYSDIEAEAERRLLRVVGGSDDEPNPVDFLVEWNNHAESEDVVLAAFDQATAEAA